MGLRILTGPQLLRIVKERIIVYGRAGIGKSRFILSLTERYGKIAYYAADSNSDLLSSIDPSKRDRIYVIVPEGDDPVKNFMKFCMTDWHAIDPEIGCLVVDTYTKVALDIIRFAANSGTMDREKHYIVGDPAEGGQAIPNRGDYQAIESLSRGFLDMLFDKQRDLHIIFACHEDVKIVENVHSVGGPAHPGRAMTEYLPAQFSTVIRLIRTEELVPGEEAPRTVVVAVTENDGKFIAKVRTADEQHINPLARVVLNQNPINFWEQYDAIFAPKEAA
jgi:hypothetical protein